MHNAFRGSFRACFFGFYAEHFVCLMFAIYNIQMYHVSGLLRRSERCLVIHEGLGPLGPFSKMHYYAKHM